MRNSRPLRWIEQAEARQVLATAVFERKPQSSRRRARQCARRFLARLRLWLIPGNPVWRSLLQPQPARVSGPAYRRDGGGADDEGCPYWW